MDRRVWRHCAGPFGIESRLSIRSSLPRIAATSPRMNLGECAGIRREAKGFPELGYISRIDIRVLENDDGLSFASDRLLCFV
jgi:hypothetical protein